MVRAQEVEGFVESLFNGEEEAGLPERAHEAVTHLGEIRAMMAGVADLIERTRDEPEDRGQIKETIKHLRVMTEIIEAEIHAAVLACTRARKTSPVSLRRWERGIEPEFGCGAASSRKAAQDRSPVRRRRHGRRKGRSGCRGRTYQAPVHRNEPPHLGTHLRGLPQFEGQRIDLFRESIDLRDIKASDLPDAARQIHLLIFDCFTDSALSRN
ncbi:hypothetical protein MTR62_08180 [Novosphingobium sp. 1949]|uniref:Uncharacterized protein n=1 Tax=Novosphingobium organovorum TaxID=2930092 RepID=A0ABT0BC80_9SPHN|nr:hypothetical protein [Novosphingobium organovorum]MCJ2182665.1 hypothetical protein [Novosphingobium organovorum]